MRALIIRPGKRGNSVELLRPHLAETDECANVEVVRYDQVDDIDEAIRADLVIVVLDVTDPNRAFAILRLARSKTTGQVLAAGPATDSQLILRALQCGADSYLDEDNVESGLDAVIDRRNLHSGGLSNSKCIVAVVGASGGVGVSTVAANLAVAFANQSENVLSIDLACPGDLAVLFDCKPEFSVADLCSNVERLDRSMFERAVNRHFSGARILAAPRDLESDAKITEQGVRKVLQIGIASSDTVVLDLSNCRRIEQQLALRLAGDVVLCVRLDYPCIRNTRRRLNDLTRAEIARSNIHLVANRIGEPGQLDVEDAEEALDTSFSCRIPNDPKTMLVSHNTGRPILLSHAQAKPARALQRLADTIMQSRAKTREPSKGIKNAITRLFAR